MTGSISLPPASTKSTDHAVEIGGNIGHPIVTPHQTLNDHTPNPADLPMQTGGGPGSEDGSSTAIYPIHIYQYRISQQDPIPLIIIHRYGGPSSHKSSG